MPTGDRVWLIAAILATLAIASIGLALDRERSAEPTAPRVEHPYFGFNEDRWGTAWQDQQLAGAVTVAAEAGANTNRLIVRWFDVVTYGGAPDEDAWSRYARAYRAMLQAGQRPIVVLVSAPRGTDQPGDPQWAPPGCTEGAASPPDPLYDPQWQAFVARAAAEFPDALAFQIWNEPNSDDFWGGPGCATDPGRYVELVRIARQAIGPARPGGPSDLIVSAGLNSAVGEPNGTEWTSYLSAAIAAGLLGDDAAQAVGVHPYPTPGTCGPTARSTARALVDAVSAQLDRAESLTPAPIWVTEFGATSARDLPDECRAIGLTGQAQVISEMYDVLAGSDRVEAAIVHQLVDQAVFDFDPSVTGYWSNFGITTDDGPDSTLLERKDAYWCLAGRRGYPNHSSSPCSFDP